MQLDTKPMLRDLVTGATVIFLISFLLHAPPVLFIPSHYNDYFVLWNREIAFKVETDRIGLPYADVFFEYPPVPALIYFLATLAPELLFDLQGDWSFLLYFIIISSFIFASYIGSIYELYKITGMLGVDRRKIWMYMVLAPSLVFFLVYNWDIIAVFFTLLALRHYLNKDDKQSGIYMGLAIASKLIPAVVGLAILIELLTKKQLRRLRNFLAPLILTYTGLNLPFIVISFDGWYRAFTYLSNFHVEDSWILYAVGDPRSPYARYISVISFLTLFTITTLTTKHTDQRVVKRSALYLSAFLFSSYIYPPQMNILLLPFFILTDLATWEAFLLFDTLNVLIIRFWLISSTLAQNLGYHVNGPLDPFSPSSIVATARCLILLIFILLLIIKVDYEKRF